MSDYGSPAAASAAAAAPLHGAAGAGHPPPNYLVWAILTTLLLCLPLGVASIVFSTQVNSKWAMGDVAGAQDASAKAKKFAMWAAIAGVVAFSPGLHCPADRVSAHRQAPVTGADPDPFSNLRRPWMQPVLHALHGRPHRRTRGAASAGGRGGGAGRRRIRGHGRPERRWSLPDLSVPGGHRVVLPGVRCLCGRFTRWPTATS